MFSLRRDHRIAFSRAALEEFTDSVTAHLNEFFPNHCRDLGETGIRKAIEHGIERAAVYGIQAKCDVCKFIDLMFLFGYDFDTDPSLSWVGPILETSESSESKMSHLYEKADENFQDARGLNVEQVAKQ